MERKQTNIPSRVNPGKRTRRLYSDCDVSTAIQVLAGGEWQRKESYGGRACALCSFGRGVMMTGASGAEERSWRGSSAGSRVE